VFSGIFVLVLGLEVLNGICNRKVYITHLVKTKLDCECPDSPSRHHLPFDLLDKLWTGRLMTLPSARME
jgi:hypothetical protein